MIHDIHIIYTNVLGKSDSFWLVKHSVQSSRKKMLFNNVALFIHQPYMSKPYNFLTLFRINVPRQMNINVKKHEPC